MTAKAFVIGHPISHSLSPLIHNYWMQSLGIDARYDAIDVAPEDLPAFFDRLRRGEFVGGNVTVPHKEAAFALCDELDPACNELGAVNTLLVKNGKVWGTNTDDLGFQRNLDAGAPGWSDYLREPILLGAGGAARGVLHALRGHRAGPIHIVNRTREKAEQLARENFDVTAHDFADFASIAPRTNLLINTTSVGMNGSSFEDLDLSLLPDDTIVTDIVYRPLETPLLATARARGLRTVDGLGMLLHQARPAFDHWFRRMPAVTPELRSRLEAALEH